MSILISSMEMPTDCTECWFRKTARHEYLSDCQLCPFTGDTTPYTKRKDDCPLAPVQFHGRLIDADVLAKRIKDEGRHQAECYANRYAPVVMAYADCYEKVESAPTIIPADEEKERK